MKIKHILYSIVFYCTACNSNNLQVKNPVGFDLSKPEKFIMPEALQEISGIAFNNDSIYAEQDEEGKVFHFKLGNKDIITSKFGKKGDYEDISIGNNKIIMLRSDGSLFSFPLAEAGTKEISNVQEWKDMMPEGEFEGMYADAATNLLYVLCKHCGDDKELNGYIFRWVNDSIIAAGNFSIDIKLIAATTGEKKIKFHPSALAKNPTTNEWYILSSVNKLLVTADSNWKVTASYPLAASLFVQPEGIAFDKNGNLYISNEAGDSGNGTILKFILKK